MANIARYITYNGSTQCLSVSQYIDKYKLANIVSKLTGIPFSYLYMDADELLYSYTECFDYDNDGINIVIDDCETQEVVTNSEINIEIMIFNGKKYFFSSYKDAESKAINSIAMLVDNKVIFDSRGYDNVGKLVELNWLPITYEYITNVEEIYKIVKQ